MLFTGENTQATQPSPRSINVVVRKFVTTHGNSWMGIANIHMHTAMTKTTLNKATINRLP